MRTIIWFLYFWCYLVAVLPLMHQCKKLTAQGRVAESDAKMRKAVRNWARRLLKLAGVKVEISGLENIPQGPVVYVGNHQGNFDVPLMLAYLREPCGLLAKEELAKVPMIKTWMKLLHCVFVERGNPTQSVAALKEAAGLLRQGYSMVIFPEGTRSKTGQLGKLKSGAFAVASQAGADILPCRIIYDTPDARMHLFCRMRICFGDPISTAGAASDDPRRQVRALRTLRTRLTDELEALYAAHHFDRPEQALPAADPDPVEKGENHADPAC